MPIWKVSLTDGTYQVADADGALYPLTMRGEPVTRFNEGWSPRGLQTGLPPFHVLELEHEGGDSTIWLHDETLDYLANAVLGLAPDDLNRFLTVMEPIFRTVYAECVLAPLAAIPAAAHQFDGMLPRTIALLGAEAIRRAMPGTDLVVLDRLQELDAGYGSGTDALSADWITRAIDAPPASAQERFELPGRQCDRHVDPDNGLVFYVMRSDDPSETSLFVPQHSVVFVRSRHTHDPLALLLAYYAGHTDRAVALPEAMDLAPDMVVPPQHGLDEPPVPEDHPVASAPEHGRTVFEAPLTESAAALHAEHEGDIGFAPEPLDTIDADPEPPASDQHHGITQRNEMPPAAVPPPVAVTGATRAAAPPKQNWWQRLLGLGDS